MEDQKQQQKACLTKEHDNNYITMICLDKDCQQESRTLCCRCLYEQKHQNCQQTFLFKDFRSYKIIEQCYKYQAKQMGYIYEYLKTECSKALFEIENTFQEMIEQFQTKMYKLMKEEKIRIQEGFESIKKECEKIDFFNRIETQRNLDYIQQYFDLYLKEEINIQKYNDILKEQQKKYFSLKEMEEIQEKFQETKNLYKDFKPRIILQEIKNQFQQFYDNSLQLIKQQNKQLLNGFEINNKLLNPEFDQKYLHTNSGHKYIALASNKSFEIEDQVKLNIYFKDAYKQKGAFSIFILDVDLIGTQNQVFSRILLYRFKYLQNVELNFSLLENQLFVNEKKVQKKYGNIMLQMQNSDIQRIIENRKPYKIIIFIKYQDPNLQFIID